MRGPQGVEAAFAGIPANRFFGFRLVSRTPRRAILRMPVKRSYLQEGGVVHGGVLSALADTAAVYLLFPDLGPDETMTSIELKISFVRPAVLGAGDLEARASPVKRGRRVVFCDVEVFQKRALVAKGLFTYLLGVIEQGGAAPHPLGPPRAARE